MCNADGSVLGSATGLPPLHTNLPVCGFHIVRGLRGARFQLQFSLQRIPEIHAEFGQNSLDCRGHKSDDSRGMRIFTIDAGNTIAVSTSTERGSKSGAARFTNEKQNSGAGRALAEHPAG